MNSGQDKKELALVYFLAFKKALKDFSETFIRAYIKIVEETGDTVTEEMKRMDMNWLTSTSVYEAKEEYDALSDDEKRQLLEESKEWLEKPKLSLYPINE